MKNTSGTILIDKALKSFKEELKNNIKEQKNLMLDSSKLGKVDKISIGRMAAYSDVLDKIEKYTDFENMKVSKEY
tara:strand:- start:199 stop:423 length:225 start_codon:yes stop_codon:yes gene_type:complete